VKEVEILTYPQNSSLPKIIEDVCIRNIPISQEVKRALENEYIGLEFSNDTIRNPKVKQTTKKC
jgi:hypothetical protein